jgi:TPR repeat protein
MLRILTVLVAMLAAPAVAAADSIGSECDHLAAHPYDPAIDADGVAFDAIDPARALMSCGTAYSEQPDTVRYKYQYGRALLAANRPNEALIFIRSAADNGYAAAQQSLATILYDDENIWADKIAAIRLFHKAAAQGHAVAQLRVASFYLRGEGSLPDLPKAMKFALQAADQGLPAAHTALKVIVGALGQK